MTLHSDPAEIVRLQQKQEAKFICSACGADRGCDCNAPALEKLAAERERQRQKAKAWRQNEKSKENQSPRTGTESVENDDKLCERSHRSSAQPTEYEQNQSSRHVTDSNSAAKPKRFNYEPEPGGEIARLKRVYGEDLKPQPIQQDLKDVAVRACAQMNLTTLDAFAVDFEQICWALRNKGGPRDAR